MKMSEKMGAACCGEEQVMEACIEVKKVNISSGEDAFTAHDSLYGAEHATSVEQAWQWHEYESAKQEEYQGA